MFDWLEIVRQNRKLLKVIVLVTNPKWKKIPSRLEYYVIEIKCIRLCTPDLYEEAIQSNDSVKWIYAMDEDIRNMEKYNTWELVEPPTNALITPVK